METVEEESSLYLGPQRSNSTCPQFDERHAGPIPLGLDNIDESSGIGRHSGSKTICLARGG